MASCSSSPATRSTRTARTTTALTFLRALLDHEPGLARIGVPAYPDGHPLIDRRWYAAALHDKQALIAEAGLAGSVTTQMCLDPAQIDSG